MRSAGFIILLASLLVGGAVAAAVLRAGHPADAADVPSVAKELTGFAEIAPLPDSAVPASVYESQQTVPEQARLGSAVQGQTRLLRANLGADDASVYAYPTSSGAICTTILDRTTFDTCVPQFERRLGSVALSMYGGDGTPATVTGLASDLVRAVTVVTDRGTFDATIDRNVLFWQASGLGQTHVTGVRVTFRDGTTLDRAIDFTA